MASLCEMVSKGKILCMLFVMASALSQEKTPPAGVDAASPASHNTGHSGQMQKADSSKTSAAESTQAPRLLHASSVKPLQIPTFSSYGESLCDDAGNMYFHLAMGGYSNGHILRTSRDGEQSTLYRLSNDFQKTAVFISFNVTPLGKVRELVETPDGIFIVDFDSGGEMKSRTRLEVPDYVSPQDFASFENDVTVFYGYHNRKGAEKLQGQTYLGIFAASGQLLRHLPDSDSIDLGMLTTIIPSGAATLGKDNNLYLLRAKEIVVFSQAGEVVRRMPFEKDPHSAATKIIFSDGLIALTLMKTEKPKAFRTYLVLDSQSGERRGFYAPSDETGNGDVCFSRSEGFVFLHTDSGKLTLVSARLR